jgi:hypothetical protein
MQRKFITAILLYVGSGLHQPWQVRSNTHTHKALASSTFYVGVPPTQADGRLAEHARDELAARESVVALLGGTGPDVVDELPEGLPQAPIGLYRQGHEVVAARSIPPVLGRLLRFTTGSSASISLSCGCAVRYGTGVDDGDVATAHPPRRRAGRNVLPLVVEHSRGLGCGARGVWAPWLMARLPGAACGAQSP